VPERPREDVGGAGRAAKMRSAAIPVGHGVSAWLAPEPSRAADAATQMDGG